MSLATYTLYNTTTRVPATELGAVVVESYHVRELDSNTYVSGSADDGWSQLNH